MRNTTQYTIICIGGVPLEPTNEGLSAITIANLNEFGKLTTNCKQPEVHWQWSGAVDSPPTVLVICPVCRRKNGVYLSEPSPWNSSNRIILF